ncbi:MAG TPA: DUF2252 domain-containing protein [Nocardioides sp.]|nr:DUF2252 domain-containing protein [Nocardioides sp.]
MSVSTVVPHPSPEVRAALGVAAREKLPREQLAELVVAPDRPSVVALMQDQAQSRLPELVPLRHARMAASPFAFFRGSARAMAMDIAASPHSGLRVQLCGDAHLSNFGVFGSAERRLLFDLNDFDETCPGPWEWDLKRLAASLAVAGRANGFPMTKRDKIVRQTVRRYRDAMWQFAGSHTLDVWYASLDIEEVQALLRSRITAKQDKKFDTQLAKARSRTSLKAFEKLAETVDGVTRIRSDPPLVVPARDLAMGLERSTLEAWIRDWLAAYRDTLSRDRGVLMDRFQFVDIARKVVGVGSVGTRCWIVLLQGRDAGDPLFLQVKEAQESVLAPFVSPEMLGDFPLDHQGHRVVAGQRMMQASGDIFLGWLRAEGLDGVTRDFYGRQLRDMKGSAEVETQTSSVMRTYGELCAWTLARAHARSGDPIAIASYLGKGDAVPEALIAFAEQYADLTERDHADLLEAIARGDLVAAESAS